MSQGVSWVDLPNQIPFYNEFYGDDAPAKEVEEETI